jgi:hypothetical protein
VIADSLKPTLKAYHHETNPIWFIHHLPQTIP